MVVGRGREDFSFLFNLIENYVSQLKVLRRLIWVCTVCLCPIKNFARLIWVDKAYVCSVLSDEMTSSVKKCFVSGK